MNASVLSMHLERYGATPSDWQHFVGLGLTEDLIPVVSNPHAPVKETSALYSKPGEPTKLGKVPSRYDYLGEAVGFGAWPEHRATAGRINKWSEQPDYGIGIITGRQVDVFDIDVPDPRHSRAIRGTVERITGRLPCRMRSNSGKILLAFRLASDLPKRVLETAHGNVEFLANGQQFVAVGAHPSGVRYEWEGGLPAAIPELTLDQVEAAFASLEAEWGGAPWLVSGAASTVSRERDMADANDKHLGDLWDSGVVIDEGRGGLLVTCYQSHLHTNGDVEALYYPAGVGGRSEPGYKCLHGHCAKATARGLFESLGIPWDYNQASEVFDKVVLTPEQQAEDEAAAARREKQKKESERTSADVIEELRAMPRDAVLQNWAGAAVRLRKDAAYEVIDEVTRLTGVKSRVLAAALNEERAKVAAVAAREEMVARAAGRKVIEYRPEDQTLMARASEKEVVAKAKPGAYINHAGLLSRVVEKPMPYTHLIDDEESDAPSVAHIEPMDDAGVLAQMERAVVFTKDGELISVPPRIVDILIKKKDHAAPLVSGLVTHPIVLPQGEILSQEGLHAGTGLFIFGANVPDVRPYTKAEAAAALVRLQGGWLEGFEFADDLGRDAAIAALFTAVQRRLLDQAPGLAVLASAQSSGKTTLMRRLHVILTGRDLPVMSFPEGDESEVGKRLLSTLLRSPAMAVFDNVTDGTTFRSSAIAGAMTSPIMVQRVLGLSREAEALTNTMFGITGNNLGFGADELTRWLTVHLAPKSARPSERVFKNPDVVAHATRMRGEVLRDTVGIIAGYLVSGDKVAPGNRFPRWDRQVRQPLIWAGGADMARVFRDNSAMSEETMAHSALLSVLLEAFGEDKFTATRVAEMVKACAFGSAEENESRPMRMRSALLSLRSKDPRDERSVGRALNGLIGRAAVLEDKREVVLRDQVSQGRRRYWVSSW